MEAGRTANLTDMEVREFFDAVEGIFLCNNEYDPYYLGFVFLLECQWNDGRVYKGEWHKGLAHGQGVETYPDGQICHEGLWFKDKPVSLDDPEIFVYMLQLLFMMIGGNKLSPN
jgi:MORN repeat